MASRRSRRLPSQESSAAREWWQPSRHLHIIPRRRQRLELRRLAGRPAVATLRVRAPNSLRTARRCGKLAAAPKRHRNPRQQRRPGRLAAARWRQNPPSRGRRLRARPRRITMRQRRRARLLRRTIMHRQQGAHRPRSAVHRRRSTIVHRQRSTAHRRRSTIVHRRQRSTTRLPQRASNLPSRNAGGDNRNRRSETPALRPAEHALLGGFFCVTRLCFPRQALS